MAVILLGPPGVGKGTQAVQLVDHAGWVQVSTGDLLRSAVRDGTELGRKARSFMDTGDLVPDDLILDLVRGHLAGFDPEQGVLFDGFPRTIAQADGLGAVLAESGRTVDSVVVFEAPDETLIKRLSGRRSCPECGAVYNVYFNPPATEGVCDRCGGALVHRSDDQPETIRRRLQVYRDQTAPLIAYYEDDDFSPVVHVGADRPVDEIQAAFRTAVGVA